MSSLGIKEPTQPEKQTALHKKKTVSLAILFDIQIIVCPIELQCPIELHVFIQIKVNNSKTNPKVI